MVLEFSLTVYEEGRKMIERIICFLLGHKWHSYPESSPFPDYKVCDRCSKSIASSPYLTVGEKEYIDRVFIDALSTNLIARSLFNEKDEEQ